MANQDYYKVLGVDTKASEADIKKAYRALARQYHPDINPGDAAAAERFKEINEAYAVLSDREKRESYDRFGRDYPRGGAPGGQANPADFADFFDTLFGGRGGGGGGARSYRIEGQDIEQRVEITLDEAFSGTTAAVQSTGSNGVPRTIMIKIPPGCESGSRIRVAAEGGLGLNGGKRGDLYLAVIVVPHAEFERRGDDLYHRAGLDAFTMMLGGEVKVPVIGSKTANLRIPGGTQNGTMMRVGGQGMPRLREPSVRGDMIVTIEAVLPTQFSLQERELLEQLRASVQP